jgi:hypothetical protein
MPAAAENRYGGTRNASHHQTQGPHPAPLFAFIALITHLPPPDSSYFVAYDEEGEQANIFGQEMEQASPLWYGGRLRKRMAWRAITSVLRNIADHHKPL